MLNRKWMTVYRLLREYDETTAGASVKGYRRGTIKKTVYRVGETVSCREKCANVGDWRRNKRRRMREYGNFQGEPMVGVVTIV